jgi:hypothetical protein
VLGSNRRGGTVAVAVIVREKLTFEDDACLSRAGLTFGFIQKPFATAGAPEVKEGTLPA